jgi:hypothetical protein
VAVGPSEAVVLNPNPGNSGWSERTINTIDSDALGRAGLEKAAVPQRAGCLSLDAATPLARARLGKAALLDTEVIGSRV